VRDGNLTISSNQLQGGRGPGVEGNYCRKEGLEAVNSIRTFLDQHPRLASWIVLSLGMVALLLWAAWDKSLAAGQLAGLVVATVALAGACAWIIGWE